MYQHRGCDIGSTAPFCQAPSPLGILAVDAVVIMRQAAGCCISAHAKPAILLLYCIPLAKYLAADEYSISTPIFSSSFNSSSQ
jgi:hypothetical protein